MEKMVGIVEDIIYRNENNGYTILAVSTDDGEKTCVGTMFQLAIGEEITMEGEFTTHPIYGLQFSVDSFTTIIPKEKNAFERYLGSGPSKESVRSLLRRSSTALKRIPFVSSKRNRNASRKSKASA